MTYGWIYKREQVYVPPPHPPPPTYCWSIKNFSIVYPNLIDPTHDFYKQYAILETVFHCQGNCLFLEKYLLIRHTPSTNIIILKEPMDVGYIRLYWISLIVNFCFCSNFTKLTMTLSRRSLTIKI